MAQNRLTISDYAPIVEMALAEDIGPGDITTLACVPGAKRTRARIIVREEAVLCGIDLAKFIFRKMDPACRFLTSKKDGVRLDPGEAFLTLEGQAGRLLTGERTALNFLQHLSGVAALTRQYAARLKGVKTRLADTRKTTPGLRVLEKYAVRVGGGHNHRLGLFDGVLIKENHIRAAGSIRRAVEKCRRAAHHLLQIEVEVASLRDLRQALACGVPVILLDNFSVEQVRRAAALIRGQALIEVSGGITLDNIRDYAEAGADMISVGRLTHSARAADMSMLFER